jgi:plastocyanin
MVRLQFDEVLMRLKSVLLLAFLIGAHICSAHEVSGTVEVTLKGDKPKSDLSSVVVYLDTLKESGVSQVSNKKHVMSTKNKQLDPRVMAVPVGTKVDFPNYDPIFHNLFSVSAPNKFDLGLYKGGTSKSHSFASPGIVRVFCNVHPQMSATIVVANSPYLTSADKNGNFSLGEIPNGQYMIRAYTEEGQTEQKISIGDTPLKVKLHIDGKTFKKVKHKNKFGKDYTTDENEKY